MNLVKAVKGLSFGGSCKISYDGQNYVITDTPEGRRVALELVGKSIAGRLAKAGYDSASLIPVPSSSHTHPDAAFCGRALAEAISAADNRFQARPVLYLDEPIPKARSGGTRNPNLIYPHLKMAEGVVAAPAVLLDDVCTSGGHLKAAERFLSKSGLIVFDAFVVGRTCWERPESMFSVKVEEL